MADDTLPVPNRKDFPQLLEALSILRDFDTLFTPEEITALHNGLLKEHDGE